jgi:hydroxyethylthiazole kinase
MPDTLPDPAATLWSLVCRLRERAPLVQCITNFVAMDVTANALLAAGASPAMVHAAEEAADFVGLGGTLSINIGTPSPPWVAGMEGAAAAARRKGTPWVLDPVAVGATPYRTDIVARLLAYAPTVIRGNAGEIMAMAGERDVVIKGVDSTRLSSEARAAAVGLARKIATTVVVTGAEDIVTDGQRVIVLANGHPLMTKVTALGCALTGLVAAFLAVADDPLIAAAAAVAYFGVCGELAADGADGPASLRTRLLDRLYTLDQATFAGRLKIVA